MQRAGCRLTPIELQLLVDLAWSHRDAPSLIYAVGFYAPLSATAVTACCFQGQVLMTYQSHALDAVDADRLQRVHMEAMRGIPDVTKISGDATKATRALLERL